MDSPVLPLPGRHDGLVVLVVDGHRLVAESLARLLPRLGVVADADFATSASRVRQVLARRTVDVVLSDETIDGESVLAMAESGTAAGRHPALVVFTATSDPRRTARALRSGVAAWVARDCGLEDLEDALAAVRDGRLWVSPHLRPDLIEVLAREAGAVVPDGPAALLSRRQLEVLDCLMDGMSHGQVAETLQLSLTTVRTHVQHMCRLAGVHSTPALVAAARHGQLAAVPAADGRRPR